MDSKANAIATDRTDGMAARRNRQRLQACNRLCACPCDCPPCHRCPCQPQPQWPQWPDWPWRQPWQPTPIWC